MNRILALIILVAAVGISTPAEASHPGVPATDNFTKRLLNYSWYYYRRTTRPASQCSHVVFGLPDRPYDPAGVAWATQPGCEIWVRPEHRPRDRDSAAAYCAILMHELGHNIGLNHITGTASSPMNVERTFTHPGCYGPKHVLHRHRHRHTGRYRNGRYSFIHYHRHYHLKVGQP